MPVLALTVFVLATISSTRAHAGATTEHNLVNRTNAARAHDGLRVYSVSSDLTAIARRWAGWMAAHHRVADHPSGDAGACCWRSMGENAGRGASSAVVHRAFMASPPHRDNILDRGFTQIGVGTAWGSDGTLYVDEVFRQPDGS